MTLLMIIEVQEVHMYKVVKPFYALEVTVHVLRYLVPADL
jgi:hypothetical protein